MLRIKDIDKSLDFYCHQLGLVEVARHNHEEGRFTLIFLSAPDDQSAQIELTFNWDEDDEALSSSRSFGHLAYAVDDIYQMCQRLHESGVVINRPPRDGRMAFVRSPDNISIELLQQGAPLAPTEPWVSMKNTGDW